MGTDAVYVCPVFGPTNEPHGDTDCGNAKHAPNYAATVTVLDQAYPNGWRSGHDTTDAMTVILTTGLRQIVTGILAR